MFMSTLISQLMTVPVCPFHHLEWIAQFIKEFGDGEVYRGILCVSGGVLKKSRADKECPFAHR